MSGESGDGLACVVLGWVSGRKWAAPGKSGREVERAEQGKGKEWVGPEGIPGWATRLICFFFLFLFLFYFLFQTKLNLFEFK